MLCLSAFLGLPGLDSCRLIPLKARVFVERGVVWIRELGVIRGLLIVCGARHGWTQIHIWTRLRCQGGFKLKKHVLVQMQSYIRPLGEDSLWSSGPDDICASSPYHDRGLKGPVPDQG